MARWKLFSGGKKLEISRIQTVHCVIKNAISPKVFNRFSKTFLLSKDVENRYLGRKFHDGSCFSFAMARWKLLEKGNVHFPHSKLYTVSEETLYHQRYSTVFEKFSFCWKMWKIGIWEENFMSAAIRVFQLQGENFFQAENFKLYIVLSSCTLCHKKCYITKIIQPLFKNFPSAERCRK